MTAAATDTYITLRVNEHMGMTLAINELTTFTRARNELAYITLARNQHNPKTPKILRHMRLNTYRCTSSSLLRLLEIFRDFSNPWAPLPLPPLSLPCTLAPSAQMGFNKCTESIASYGVFRLLTNCASFTALPVLPTFEVFFTCCLAFAIICAFCSASGADQYSHSRAH